VVDGLVLLVDLVTVIGLQVPNTVHGTSDLMHRAQILCFELEGHPDVTRLVALISLSLKTI